MLLRISLQSSELATASLHFQSLALNHPPLCGWVRPLEQSTHEHAVPLRVGLV